MKPHIGVGIVVLHDKPGDRIRNRQIQLLPEFTHERLVHGLPLFAAALQGKLQGFKTHSFACDDRLFNAETAQSGKNGSKVLVLAEGIETEPQAEALGKRELFFKHFPGMQLPFIV